MDDVHLWMIDQHLGRRSVSDFQRGVLALRKREILTARRQAALASTPGTGAEAASTIPTAAAGEEGAFKSREDLAKAARLSSSQVVMIEKIQKQAAPELVAAVKSGVISINAAAAVASLPEQEQVAAASAGKDELKQAAKRVRDAKRVAREAMASHQPPATAAVDAASGEAPVEWTMEALRERVTQLEAENAHLRRQLAEVKPF
jgi:hypothetical protein